ncbi:uncharacterized protein LOC109542843 [Dendroctonus ponderosae]|uniref:Protein TsetseEP domain-containing protein n=1 Tax=Dendroctonus ponderosae TaxID=77166 RepID=I6LV94_DENPD|nr:uncharacterized protein LOC109542843 [Dendroctonus ponderosae]AEE63029.1 unknown [Dendroctonus ponderosae]AEE63105.1 unknown [Dendroctonus ponderosae]ERL84812.1 hypothetical protein D910_02236 [Dendroctonus ponderosae]KAH1013010.1 hypothetical protein HUJ05_012068 [Dendroctonus ponderosae]
MKFFAAFFVTLLAVHASTQTPVNDASTKEVLIELLNDALKVSAALLSTANSVLNDFKTNETETAEGLANLVAKRLQTINEVVVDLVDELKDGATDQGRKVLSCVDAEKDNVDAAILKTALILADNTLTEIPLLTDLAELVLTQGAELQEDVKLLVDTLETCDSSDTICLTVFAVSATKIIKEAVENGQEDVDALVTVVKSIISDVQAWDVRGTIREDIQAIFNDVVVCIYS